MLIGPSAAGARMVESFAGWHYHPFSTMATSPFVGAWAFEAGGSARMVGILNGLAFLNLALVAALWFSSRGLRQRGR